MSCRTARVCLDHSGADRPYPHSTDPTCSLEFCARSQACQIIPPQCLLPQFPDGEWSNILLGRFVDLDHILSGIYARLPSEPVLLQRLSNPTPIGLSLGNDAAIFIFPNRQTELNAYGKFIQQLFMSFSPEKHLRVIHYDFRPLNEEMSSFLTMPNLPP